MTLIRHSHVRLLLLFVVRANCEGPRVTVNPIQPLHSEERDVGLGPIKSGVVLPFEGLNCEVELPQHMGSHIGIAGQFSEFNLQGGRDSDNLMVGLFQCCIDGGQTIQGLTGTGGWSPNFVK